MSKSVKLKNSDAIAGRTKKSAIAASAGDAIAQPARASLTRLAKASAGGPDGPCPILEAFADS